MVLIYLEMGDVTEICQKQNVIARIFFSVTLKSFQPSE